MYVKADKAAPMSLLAVELKAPALQSLHRSMSPVLEQGLAVLLPAPLALLPDWNAITEIRIWTVGATRLPFREAAIKMELRCSSGTAPFPPPSDTFSLLRTLTCQAPNGDPVIFPGFSSAWLCMQNRCSFTAYSKLPFKFKAKFKAHLFPLLL